MQLQSVLVHAHLEPVHTVKSYTCKDMIRSIAIGMRKIKLLTSLVAGIDAQANKANEHWHVRPDTELVRSARDDDSNSAASCIGFSIQFGTPRPPS
jgi:hypothetical protein